MSDSTQRGGGMSSFSLAGISSTYAQYQAQPQEQHTPLYWNSMFKALGFDSSAEPPQNAYANGSGYAGQAPGVAEAGGGVIHLQHGPSHATQQAYGSVSYREAPPEHGSYPTHGGYTSYSTPAVAGYPAGYGGR